MINVRTSAALALFIGLMNPANANDHAVKFEKGYFKNYVSQENTHTGERFWSVFWQGQRMILQDGRCFMEYQNGDGFVEKQSGDIVKYVPKVVKTKINVSCSTETA